MLVGRHIDLRWQGRIAIPSTCPILEVHKLWKEHGVVNQSVRCFELCQMSTDKVKMCSHLLRRQPAEPRLSRLECSCPGDMRDDT